ncbi:MAG: MetS family NSS transporter small subunit [Cytophagales bacterium]|nr:MetS family NSS transporter small subunit [Cytophagales bacterium]
MSTLSIISMILNLTIIAGGFCYFLSKAIRKEILAKPDQINQTDS